jgi:transcriptional regulator with XRE-family HTH domain
MITPVQSRGARGILDWTQDRLATEAGVSLSTVKDFEAGRRTPIGNNLAALRRALEYGGIEFIQGNGGGPGARLRKPVAVHAEPTSNAAAGTKTAARKKAPSKGDAGRPRRTAKKPADKG